MNYLDKDAQNIWHPYTQMKLSGLPVLIEKAKDTLLFAEDGKIYIDAISSWWVNLHGHSNKSIADRIAKQALELEQVIFAGFTHKPAIELADNLLKVLPEHFSKVFYSDNGSTAVEVALKMALQLFYNKGEIKKTKFLAFKDAYHGDTFGAMAASARSAFNGPFNSLLFQVEHLDVPNEENVNQLITQINNLAKEQNIAGFIFEPLVQGAAGMKMHKPEHLDMLIKAAQENGILCIADEVMTGFGRTGKNFAIEYLTGKPDIICLSKGITGGFMPFGATICTNDIYSAFYSDDRMKTFFHGHSYTANPLACAAALASLELLLSESCRNQIAWVNRSHLEFKKYQQNNQLIKDIRITGTIMAIELKTEETTSYFNDIGKDLYSFCMEHGVLLRPLGNILYVMPPYCITEQELNTVYEVMIKAVNSVGSTKFES